MKISYKWLVELTGVDWSPEKVAERLTLCGTACEDIIPTARFMDKVVVGKVSELKSIEGASKIRLATVDIGSESLDLVCGAPNVAIGQKVPVATLGAKIAGGLTIKRTKIRGVESRGMICSELELGISDDHSGILVLDPEAVIGTPIVEHLDFDDYILEFELTPNRGDSMSAIGIARDLAALASTKVKRPEIAIKKSSEKASDHIKVTIEDPEGCPRYTARIIKNIRIGQSPWWLKKKLITADIRPISNVVDITNLVMLETGNPLHAFDLDQFGSNEIVVKRAGKGDKFITLDGDERELSGANVMITNGQAGVAVGGVMGGLNSEVVDSTSTVLLEAAYFTPSIIRQSRKQLGLVTESSIRFEKGVDPNNVQYAMDRAAYLFQELCGGEVLAGMVDCYPEPIQPKKISLRPDRCRAILGTDISTARMQEILTLLEFELSGDDPIEAMAPTFRHDMALEIDLIEEVIRIEGFDAVKDSTENIGPLYAPQHPIDQRDRGIRRVLTAAGFDETLDHGLGDSKKATLIDPQRPQLRIINPVSEDLDIVRNSLVPSMLNAISHNLAHRNMSLRLFEIGKAYFPPNSDGEWVEADRLALALTGDLDGNWRDKPRPLDFYDLTGAIRALCDHYDLPEFRFEASPINLFDDKKSFDLFAGDQKIGHIGYVKSKIARKFDIKPLVILAELEISLLVTGRRILTEFIPLPTYPAAPRDLALVVDNSTRVGDLIATVKKATGDLAESVQLFDLYTGKQIDEGKKSVGIAITYRSADRSLSSEEIEAAQDRAVKALVKNHQAIIRDK